MNPAESTLRLVDLYYQQCEKPAADCRRAFRPLLTQAPVTVYYDRFSGRMKLAAVWAPEEDFRQVAQALEKVGYETDRASDEIPLGRWVKVAVSPALNRTLQWLNFIPGETIFGTRNLASPVAAMLTTGLLGGGLGYGTGWLLERMLPERWDRGRTRQATALLGALLGAAPGAAWAINNALAGKSIFSPWPLTEADAIQNMKSAFDLGTGTSLAPAVDVDEFNRAIWAERTVANRLNPATQLAASAAVGAAHRMPGGIGPGWVTPRQMAHLAAGMGVGYASGSLVGKVLGMLTGMPKDTQETLKQTGMYAGLVQAVIPKLFGD